MMLILRYKVLILLAVIPLRALAFDEAPRFLIAASPSTSTIAYLRLPPNGAPATGAEPMRVLLNEGLSVPQGVAVDDYRKRLYVADPDLHKLVAYDISYGWGGSLVLGKQLTVIPNVEVRWVSVDGLGNVYFTDEATNKIYKVSAKDAEAGTQSATVLYDGTSEGSVSSPGGIATDNFFVYWVNKASGTQIGSLIRAIGLPGANNALPEGVDKVLPMSKNIMKSYGVCIGSNNLFYTDEQSNMYALPRQGGTPQIVTSGLAEPRGCVHDGSNTVYVADKMHSAIYSFAGNAKDFGDQSPTLKKAADLQGAYGVTLFTKVMP